MKTFTAKQLSKQPAAVFREVDLNGSAKINHDRYPDKVFIIEGRARHRECVHECDEDMVCTKCGDQCFRFERYPVPPPSNPVYRVVIDEDKG